MVGTSNKQKKNEDQDDLEQHAENNAENNEQVTPAEENLNKPHAYIYVSEKNKRPGEGERKIVAASYIKKFEYEKYTEDPKVYKEKLFKLRKIPGINETRSNCYVLYAAATYDLVQSHLKAKKRRFHIPNFKVMNGPDTSLDETLNNNSDNDREEVEELAQAKIQRKRVKESAKQTAAEVADAIISEYEKQKAPGELEIGLPLTRTNSYDFLNYESEEMLNDFVEPPKRPALSNRTNVQAAPGLTGYKIQTEYYKDKYAEALIENQKLKAMMQQFVPMESSQPMANSNNLPKSDNEQLRKTVYDGVFEISNKPTFVIDPAEAANVTEPGQDIVILNKGVKCNSNAYKDAFKTRKCQTFFTIINTGIYGTEELAKRYNVVKKSTDGADSRPLSPIKKSVVEDLFYKFFVAKGHTQSQIDWEIEQCSKYQHNSITAARKRLFRANKEVDNPGSQRNRYSSETPTENNTSALYNSHQYLPLSNSSFLNGGENLTSGRSQRTNGTPVDQHQANDGSQDKAND